MFPLLTCEENPNPAILECVKSHLLSLQSALKRYFLDLDSKKYDWIRNPISETVEMKDFKLQ